MAFEVLDHCTFTGPALPEPFVRFELEKELDRAKLLTKTTGAAGKELQESWDAYRRALRELVLQGGAVRVANHVLEPLIERLGYERMEPADDVLTREGIENGGLLMRGPEGARLRVWSAGLDVDLDAPARRGAAYRYSLTRVAQRVLLASNERLGLLSNGTELRILISDPARPDSQVLIPIDPHWRRNRDVPDSYRLLLALASPRGTLAIPSIVEVARQQQARVTKELRRQARQAIEGFLQELLSHPDNRERLSSWTSREALARQLWSEGLVLIYRLLFILKLESIDDPARGFGFASTSLWRNSFSPSVALAPIVRCVLDSGIETGGWLEAGLRNLFSMFCEGLDCTELRVAPLGGALFGDDSTPLLSSLCWNERAVAWALDRLLWTPKQRGQDSRQRVHYGSLDVEDLGRVYEALLELEPGISTEPMCRLRRHPLEVVVPIAQGEQYRIASQDDANVEDNTASRGEEQSELKASESEDFQAKNSMIEFIEDIPPEHFYLRAGLGRKATGSYYTPHAFVRFLVQQTLVPELLKRSPKEDPQPGEILKLKVLDPAMGSGHFLVDACRFLGEQLYEACRLCDEKASQAERRLDIAKREERDSLANEVLKWRQRLEDLPDPHGELFKYLPSRAPEGAESGVSQRKAEALCRRLVAVHCLYGVDKNPLAVALAKLSLWIESHGEGFPLTFLDHRLVIGDSLTGPYFEHLLTYPNSKQPLDDLFTRGLQEKLTAALRQALTLITDLESTIGTTLGEIVAKEHARRKLDDALAPFRVAAAAWAGGVMSEPEQCDDEAYADLLRSIGESGEVLERLQSENLCGMIACGLGVDEIPTDRAGLYALMKSGSCKAALPYDLIFPEVFYPSTSPQPRGGFDVILGNPPWDKLRVERRELLASLDPRFLEGKERAGFGDEHVLIESAFASYPEARAYESSIRSTRRAFAALATSARDKEVLDAPGNTDQYRLFIVRSLQLSNQEARIGLIVGGGFAKNPADAATRRLVFGKRVTNPM